MGYLLAFGTIFLGYSLLDWGYQRTKHRKVPLWYLISGAGSPGDATPPGGSVGGLLSGVQSLANAAKQVPPAASAGPTYAGITRGPQ